jgi:hypothetical protein
MVVLKFFFLICHFDYMYNMTFGKKCHPIQYNQPKNHVSFMPHASSQSEHPSWSMHT